MPTTNVTLSTSGGTANLNGTVTLTAVPSQAGQVTSVKFYLDSILLPGGTDTTSPYTYSWDTSTTSDGNHELKAVALYSKFQQAERKLSVSVSNAVAPPEPPPNYVPSNTALPTIDGDALIDQILTSQDGTWTNNPTSYSRQWLQCDAAGANCAAIPSATGSMYTVDDLDVGKTIRVAVTAYNSAGPSPTVRSAQTAVIAAGPVFTTNIAASDTIASPFAWTASTSPTADSMEFWADGTKLLTDSTSPFSHSLTLTPGDHVIGLGAWINGRRYLCSRVSQGVCSAITVSGTDPVPGTILYKKDWEDGVLNSGGWGFQGAPALGCPHTDGICYATVTVDSTKADTGTKCGRIDLPASTYKQGASMLHSRTVIVDNHEYFGCAYYFPTGWPTMAQTTGDRKGLTVSCFNYYSVNSCMVNIEARADNLITLINAGACPPSGVAPGCPYYSATPDAGNYSVCRGMTGANCGPHYIVPPGQLTLNVWHEVIMHIYYTLSLNGVVEAWHRIKGQSTWNKTVSLNGGFPTLQTGQTAFGTTVTSSNINGWPSTDYINAYRLPAASPLTCYYDNWVRATTFEAAASIFG